MKINFVNEITTVKLNLLLTGEKFVMVGSNGKPITDDVFIVVPSGLGYKSYVNLRTGNIISKKMADAIAIAIIPVECELTVNPVYKSFN